MVRLTNTLMKKLTLIFLLLASNANANDVKQEAYLSEWVSSCSSPTVTSNKICTLERHLFYDKTMSKKMVSIGFRTAVSEPVVLTIISPLGTLISEGVEVDIKGLTNKKLPFIFCDQRGCLSQVQLTEDLLATILKQKIIQLKYQLLNSNKAVVSFDVNGFDVTFAKVRQ